jgi:predicted small integral membrane protein
MSTVDDKGVARRTATGRVVDAEGVVFIRQAGTQLLPTIFERESRFTKPGQRLSGRALAALRLLEFCRDGEAAKLGIQRVNATRPDDLVAILGNYSQAKIAWEGMDAPTAETRAAMEKQVTHLVQAFQTRLATPSNGVVSTVTWNATEPGVVYADTKEPIQ